MRRLIADVRYASRVMSRTPSFAVAVVSVLALGIGANTAIFSLVNAVLLRPLPFEEPERLVRIFNRTPGGRPFELSPGKFYGWQREAQSFEGMARLGGRDIVQSDAEVLLVSRDAAKLYWGADDPVGRRATLPFSRTVFRQVVGIVGDVKQRNLIEGSTPTVYFYTREPYGRATFAIRTSVPPATLAHPAVAALRAIDPEQPVEDIRTMVQVLDGKLTSQRFSALLLGVFAGVALLLAAVGIYSVLSYIVRGRSREIGIRTALGARTFDVLRLVIVEGMSPALVGIAVGMIAVLTSAKVMATLVFGVSASDPLTLSAVAATLALVALMASLVPAYRALRLDPAKVLRADLGFGIRDSGFGICEPRTARSRRCSFRKSNYSRRTAALGQAPSRKICSVSN